MRKLLGIVPLLLIFLPVSFSLAAENEEKDKSVTTHTSIEKLNNQHLHIDGAGREFWGLNEVEWTRYLKLMRGPQGRWTPNEDPTFILGLHARTDYERKRYAKLQVNIEKKRTEQELAFVLAVTQAWEDMYPNMPLIDEGKLQAYDNQMSIKAPVAQMSQGFDPGADVLPGDRFVVFIDDACTSCKKNVTTLLTKIIPVDGAGIDLYFLQMSDQDIFQWAASLSLPQSLVGPNKRITLTKGDKGLLQLLAVAHQQEPTNYYRRRGQNYQPIAM